MPLRSPKMYSFIFGFHRFVWWPKCTPASNSSCIEIPVKLPPLLAFAELEALARSGHAVLLAFLRSRIARQESTRLQRAPQVRVGDAERAGDAQTQRAGLTSHAAAAHRREHVVAARKLRQDKRLLDLRPQRRGREELFEGAAVDQDGAAARTQVKPCGGCLAPAGAVKLSRCHVTKPRSTTAAEPRGDDPGRRRPSTSGTSHRPSLSLAACRGRPLRPGGSGLSAGRPWRALHAGRLHSRCAAGKS